ncbi:hypothetical protein M7I_4076 [Glarea lozoyensis 74030]|uniref:Uncharacterized protein n=1 Tax=Glarea lozoyensis (strain ATCC 74030 / MF5533) TaxID=1104152 RepID=H0EN73_GLAL7|nr:hypothetical protein M7I_4076 [Glarea lozoyensis 74030]
MVADNVVVATALTYTPSCGSPIPSNLPWAGRIGDDVGGVTCICISRFEEWAQYRDVWKDV